MANTKVTAKVIADGTITATQIANDAVTGAKIEDNVALAGSPTTTTQSASDNSTKIATTAYVETAVTNLVDSAPSALNTLNELAAALGDDASFSTTVTNSIATKAPLAAPTFTGDVDIDATDDLRLRFLNGGTFKGGIQVPTSTGDMISGSAVDDLAIRSQGNMLFATGGNTERLRIDSSGNATFAGTITSTGTATFTSDSFIIQSANASDPQFRIKNTNADSSAPQLILQKDSASPADDDEVGRIYFLGDDDAGNATEAFLAIGKMTDVSNSSEDSSLDLYTYAAGSQKATLSLKSGLVGINQTSPAAKLDIKGDTDTYDGMAKIYLTDTSSNANRRNWAIGNGGSGYGHFTIGVSNAADGDPLASGTHTSPFSITHDSKVGVGGGNFDYTSTFHVVGTNSSQVASNGAGIDGIQVSRTTNKGENLYLYSLSGAGWSGSTFVGRLESYGHNVLEIGGQQNIPIVFGTNNAEAFRINDNQILLHGGTRQTYGNTQRITSGSESITFSSSTSATSFTSAYNLAYQFFIDVAYHFGYSGNGAISQHFRHSIINTYSGLSISAIHSAYGQSGNNYHTMSFSGTGSYNTRRIVVTCTPASGQNASNIAGTLYFGGGV